MTRVGFGYRGFRLGAAARQVLDGLVRSLKGGRRSVWIVGHVEPTESADEGDLSFLRAREVANYLEQQGVDPSRMKVEGAGASEPLTTHRTLEGRRQSRRAEIWVLPHH
jgi:outer membrane protein OmpA-like peptidoglycan-associated protein